MSKFLTLGLDNNPQLFLTGSRCLLLVEQNQIVDVISTADDVDVVDALTLANGSKWNLFNEPEGLYYYVTPEYSKAGTLYNVEVGFTVNIQTLAKNQLFRAMAKTKLTGIVQDNNNHWWLVGLEQPLTLTENPQKIDGEVSQYTIKITGKQRDTARQMSDVWVQSLTDASFTDMIDSIDSGTLGVVFEGAANNGGTGGGTPIYLGNNFQNTISNPPFGYVIGAAIGVVYASGGSTIKLPPAAITGQQHTVKDNSGSASRLPITVLGNGHTIDGNASVKIYTDYGSITFSYSADGWMTTGYIN